FFQAEDGIRDFHVTGVQTCALPIYLSINRALLFIITLPVMSNFTSIEQVIQKLDAIIARCQKNKSPNGYFACTYRSMTLAVLKRSEERRVGKGRRCREARERYE